MEACLVGWRGVNVPFPRSGIRPMLEHGLVKRSIAQTTFPHPRRCPAAGVGECWGGGVGPNTTRRQRRAEYRLRRRRTMNGPAQEHPATGGRRRTGRFFHFHGPEKLSVETVCQLSPNADGDGSALKNIPLTNSMHTATLHDVAFSPDGRQIVSGHVDGTIRAWDSHSGQQTLTFRGPILLQGTRQVRGIGETWLPASNVCRRMLRMREKNDAHESDG